MERKCWPALMISLLLLLVIVGSTSQVFSQQGIINTFAGGGPNSPVALSAYILPQGVTVDASGNIFIAGGSMHQVVEVSAAGDFTVVAGTGTGGFSGDGGPASSASLGYPSSVAVDSHGNLFIADAGNECIRRVDAATQVITTVAGTLAFGTPDGDGGPATSASINDPVGVAVDRQGDLFIADVGSGSVRRVDGASGIITTVAGGGSGGDGGAATSAVLIYPAGIAIDNSGTVFTAENNRIRRVDAAAGIITTAAGNGVAGYSGDGGSAVAARLSNPYGVAADAQGNVFIADSNNSRIRRVDGGSGIITTIAGNGQGGFNGDGGAATSASLLGPSGVAVDAQGDLFIADAGNNRIRRVDAVTGIITTVAGSGQQGFSGDGGPATNVSLNLNPLGAVAVDTHDNLFIADYHDHRIRRVDALTGIITSVAGTGLANSTGDGGPATSATISFPMGVAVDAQGNFFVADASGRVRRVDGVI